MHLLKLDIEGAEFKVLEDCDDALGNVERMVIELHVLRQDEGRVGTLLAQLEDQGFRYVFNDLRYATWLDSKTPTPFAVCPTEQYVITVYAWQP